MEGYEVLIFLYPSILYGGFVLVLCGENLQGEMIVKHQCKYCEDMEITDCPYVQSAIEHFKVSMQKEYKDYHFIQQKVLLNEKYKQIPTPILNEKKGAVG